jgi:hypothetical protein
LRASPPDAILTGVEDAELEKAFIGYAEGHSFTPFKINRRKILWRPPAPDAVVP